MSAITAVSTSDLWAVGAYQNNGPEVPLTEHYDGRSWTAVPAPAGPWTVSAGFAGVSAAGPNDVWAVGTGQKIGSESQTLIEHWDGSSWDVTPSPDASARTNLLSSIDALSSTDIWAVGNYIDAGRDLVLTEHWDGIRWSSVPGANPASALNSLSSVSGTSADDVWAVGFKRESDPTAPQGLIEHWDGSNWRAAESPNPGFTSTLTAVQAVSSTDAWAVGQYQPPGQAFQPLVEHWNGQRWSLAVGPTAPNATVQAVAATNSGQVWLAGTFGQGAGVAWLLERWNGSSWTRTAPAKGSTGAVRALALEGQEGWAIGTYRTNPCGADWSLIEHWDGSRWAYVASPHDGPGR